MGFIENLFNWDPTNVDLIKKQVPLKPSKALSYASVDTQ
jgi:hypothetical protein